MNITEIFEKYEKEKQYLFVPLEKMTDDLGEMIENIVLYGAGSAGIAFLYYLRDVGIEPRYFADANSSKWGQYCEKIPIIDYHKIPELLGEKALIIVTINTDGKKYCKSFDESLRLGGHIGVYRNLHDAGCKNVIDYTYFRRVKELFHGDKYNLPSCSDIFIMENHEKEMEQVYNLLADNESRDIFAKIVYFRMIDDKITIPTNQQNKQYFEYDYFSKNPDEVFVDCGAYNGISLQTFLSENSSFNYYYGFEPDMENFLKLESYVESLPQTTKEKVKIIPKAVYNSNTGAKLYDLHGPGSFITDIGTENIDTITIDEALRGNKATFIKMNIEGSELQALEGAQNTIKKWKPRLAIAAYHKTWDLWKVPLTLYRMDSSYRFYLRSYMNNLSFVYYIV